MFNQVTFGEKLKSIRKGSNLTQEEVAEKIGVSGQAVSKWEKGECLPDVYNLKLLGRLYHVSVDSLLETEPDVCENESPNKGTRWEKDSEWLRSSRKDMWNLEYFSFLVNQVWRISRPVKIVDFGCGIGYLGSVLLPLLPIGSTYTGIDISSILLKDAHDAFANTEWSVEFVEQDLTKYIPEEKYDIAICQTLLIHIPSPVAILEKMIQSVVQGGKVICIEPNWAVTSTGVSVYRHGMEVFSYDDWGIHQKILDNEVARGGTDRYIGIKIPAIMHDLGLKNIDVRINDKANFTFQEPDKKTDSERTEWRKKPYYQPKNYISAGLNPQEAKRHVEGIIRTEDFVNNRNEPLPVVYAFSYLISYGEK